MKDKVMNVLKNGAMTVEEISATSGVSAPAVEIILENLTQLGMVQPVDGKYTLTTAPVPVQNEGDIMQTVQTQTSKKTEELTLTPEQAEFRKLVQNKRGDIYDANKVLIHRGAQILFAGCGKKAFRYKIAVSGFSDKEPIEYPVMYLDWDDSALYDEGGIRDQIEAIVGKPQPTIAPTIVATGVQGAK